MNIFFLTLVLLSGCSFKKGQIENQTQKGHEELYSEPAAPSKTKAGYHKVVIAATNDMHGHFEPQNVSFKDDHNNNDQTIGIGGVDVISSYFRILREVSGSILLVDSGDIFPNKTSQMNFVKEYYDTLEYDAITVGLGDFNLRLPSKYPSSSEFFKEFAKSSKTPLILGNLYEVKTGRVVEWPGTLPYLIREVNDVKVGIIGLVPDDIVSETPIDNRVGLYLEGMLQSTLRHARLLRSLGAEIIVVVSHQGINCGEKIASDLNLPVSKVNFEPHRKDMCDLSGKMGEFLNRLPPNLVDLFIGGRNHIKTANVVNGTIVLSGFEDGKSFNYVEFLVDKKTGKVNPELTKIHQPVMFCREFFKDTNDCYYEDTSVNHKFRTQAEFLGKVIEPDPVIEQKFQFYFKDAVTPKTTSASPLELLKTHDADIAFRGESSGHSKLVLLEISGKELASILEEDFNQDLTSGWIPTPFKTANGAVSLSIRNENIESSKTYRLLSDIEDLQKHSRLRRLIPRIGNKTFSSSSWNMSFKTDDVSTAQAAPALDTSR